MEHLRRQFTSLFSLCPRDFLEQLTEQATEAWEQSRFENVRCVELSVQCECRSLALIDFYGAFLPVNDPIFQNALTRVELGLDLAVAVLVAWSRREDLDS